MFDTFLLSSFCDLTHLKASSRLCSCLILQNQFQTLVYDLANINRVNDSNTGAKQVLLQLLLIVAMVTHFSIFITQLKS